MKEKKTNIFGVVVGYLLIIFSSILIMVGGSFSSITKIEHMANEIAKIAHDNGGYINIYANVNDESFWETNTLNSIFHDVRSTNNLSFGFNPCQMTVNYNLTEPISSTEINSNDLVVIMSDVFSNHLDTQNNIVLDSYPFHLMYRESNSNFIGEFDNFCYITKKQADYLINTNNYSDYDELIGKPLEINISDNLETWKISNIILDSGKFYEGCETVFEDFIVSYTNVNYRQNISISNFFYSDFYSNFDKLRKIYNNNSYFAYSIYEKKLSEETVDVLSNAISYLNGDDTSISFDIVYFFIFLSISVLILVLSLALIIRYGKNLKLNLNLLLIVLAFFIPYAILKIIFSFTLDYLIFSYFSCVLYLIVFVTYIIAFLVTGNKRKRKK